MKKILSALAMLLLALSAYADGTILFSTPRAASMLRLTASRALPVAMADASLRAWAVWSAAPTQASDA